MIAGDRPDTGDGTRVTQAEYDYKTAIRETAYVESTVDGDSDGRLDRIAADIIRPAESANGLKVPVIMVTSPYFARTNAAAKSGSRMMEPAVDDDYKDPEDDGTPSKFPDWYDNYFVPRGYAVVLVDLPGTRASEGCLTNGGRGETLGAKAVVDWIGGRGRAVNKAGQAVAASWSTGKVGMVGRSYRGTTPLAVAAEDVPNLKTIVPLSAVGSWYDYMRHDGIVRQPDWPRYIAARWGSTRLIDPNECKPAWDKIAAESAEDTGNYNAFWAERDYTKDAAKVKASVLMVHGLNDWNVLTRLGQQYWQGLAPGTPRKLWLHQAAHVDPVQVRPTEWVNTLHRWFDFWLKGIDNGIMAEPQVDLEQSPGKWKTAAAWPAPTATTQRYWFAPPSQEGAPGGLAGTPPGPPGTGFQQSFTDTMVDGSLALSANPEQKKDNRLVFLGPALTRDTRLSGVADVKVRASVSAAGGPLTAMLVDYGPGDHLAHDEGKNESGLIVDGEQCIGQGTPSTPVASRNHARTCEARSTRSSPRGGRTSSTASRVSG